MQKPFLFVLALFISLTSSAAISNFQIISESGKSYFQFNWAPENASENLTLIPETFQNLTNGQFNLTENFSIQANLSSITLLYDIDRTANETIFTGSLNLWCGASYSTCNNCNGMPPGTFKWCNGNYPEHTGWCDTWCYSFSPNANYEKAQVGAYQRAKAWAEIKLEKTSEILAVNETASYNATENASVSLVLPAVNPPSQSMPMIRPYSSEKWKVAKQSEYQNYRNYLSTYYSQYVISMDLAYSSTNNLNGALGSLIGGSSGEYYDYYEYAPPEQKFPELTLKINLDFAGAYALRGKPKIISLASHAQFESANPYFAIEIKNEGDLADSFTANLTCNETIFSSISFSLGPNAKTNLKFFTPQITSPTNCTALAYVTDAPAIADSISQTLEPFKIACPGEMQCCFESLQFADKLCIPQELFQSVDQYGNGYFYLQNYSCENHACIPRNATRTREITGNGPSSPSSPSSSYSDSSSSSYPGGFSLPKNTPTPTPEPTPTPTPHPTSALDFIPIKEEEIQLVVPEAAQEGYVEIRVVSSSGTPGGNLELATPSHKEHEIPLQEGRAEVLFNEIGIWKVKYKTEAKLITVSPIRAQTETKSAPTTQAEMATGFMALNFSRLPLIETAFLLSFFVLGYAGFRRYSERIRFTKTFENNIVRLEILNNKADLKNLEITDIVPEGNVLSTISNPPSEVTEIIFGKHIKWKKGELRKGERMLISYSIFSNNTSDSIRPAELLAEMEGNKRIIVLSNPISAT
jgi:hypothetical protein